MSKRQSVFFTSVDPMNKAPKDPDVINLDAPRLAWYKQKESVEETSKRTQIILYDTLSAYCVPKAIMMGSGEIIYEKVYASPRFSPKISFKNNWMKELGSEVAGDGKDSQQTQPKTKNPIVRTGRLVLSQQQFGSSVQEIENVPNLAAKAPMKEQGDLFSSCVPVSVKRLDQDKDADENVDADHVGTVRPVESEQSIDLFTMREDIGVDFRVSGLPHAVVKQAENFRVRELVKKIESHPHRRAFQADLQQNNTCNPFSEESRVMIRDMGNVELFELCETTPKVQCSKMLSLLELSFSPMAIGRFLNPELRHQEGATSRCSARQN